MTQVLFNTYGKARVRLVKVIRHDSYWHDLKQLTVKVLLEGDFESSYSEADNSKVVPTDTCKNIVYVVAHQHSIDSIESFGVSLSEKFLSDYIQIRTVDLEIVEELWERMTVAKDGHEYIDEKKQKHGHSFFKLPFVKLCHIRASKLGPSSSSSVSTPTTSTTTSTTTTTTTSNPVISKLEIESGLRDLVILKTTQSGFEGYPKCRYTTLPETKDRLLGTNVHALWTYTTEAIQNYYFRNRHSTQSVKSVPNVKTSKESDEMTLDFEKVFHAVKEHIFTVFANHYSPSVQRTIYLIGDKILKSIPVIDQITLILPNIHNWSVDYSKLKLPPSNEVFIPIDEPHGLIKAALSRRKLQYSRL
jgi:urate oxidase